MTTIVNMCNRCFLQIPILEIRAGLAFRNDITLNDDRKYV